MREFWRQLNGLISNANLVLVFAASLANSAWADFDQTTAVETDTGKFGGMSKKEVENLKKLQTAYSEAVSKTIEQFDAGDKSSKFDNKNTAPGGRYSGYGEAHIQHGDSMISHEGGANALEKAVEEGALGKVLLGQARVDANQKEMEKNTMRLPVTPGAPPQLDSSGKVANFKNNSTGKLQVTSYEISAALYDAGAAHPGAGGEESDHRIYVVKDGVRVAVEKNAVIYADKTVQDAKLGKNKQPNLDLLQKAYSKMEQDKYVMMATDAFALRSARLQGVNTSKPENKFVIGEYKQMAIDIYASTPNIKEAEEKIQVALAQRVAEKRAAGPSELCPDGSVQGKQPCKQIQDVPFEKTAADLERLADAVLDKLNTPRDGVKRQAILAALNLKPDVPTTPGSPPQKVNFNAMMRELNLEKLSGIVERQKLDNLYAEAKQNLSDTQQKKLAEYKSRMTEKNCLSFRVFCYAPGVAGPLSPPAAGTAAAAPSGAAGSQSLIDKDDYQVVTGDPGGYFKDTRELLYNNFAFAYNRPLAEWEGIVKNSDFSGDTDNMIKGKVNFAKGQDGEVQTSKQYAEFMAMKKFALDQANAIRDNADKNFKQRVSAAGSKIKVQGNYGAGQKNDFDPNRKTMMELFGQNKERDAVMMDWRKPGGSGRLSGAYINKTREPNRGPTSRTFPKNQNPAAPRMN